MSRATEPCLGLDTVPLGAAGLLQSHTLWQCQFQVKFGSAALGSVQRPAWVRAFLDHFIGPLASRLPPPVSRHSEKSYFRASCFSIRNPLVPWRRVSLQLPWEFYFHPCFLPNTMVHCQFYSAYWVCQYWIQCLTALLSPLMDCFSMTDVRPCPLPFSETPTNTITTEAIRPQRPEGKRSKTARACLLPSDQNSHIKEIVKGNFTHPWKESRWWKLLYFHHCSCKSDASFQPSLPKSAWGWEASLWTPSREVS